MDGAVVILPINTHLPHDLWGLSLRGLEHQCAGRVDDGRIEVDEHISSGKELHSAAPRRKGQR